MKRELENEILCQNRQEIRSDSRNELKNKHLRVLLLRDQESDVAKHSSKLEAAVASSHRAEQRSDTFEAQARMMARVVREASACNKESATNQRSLRCTSLKTKRSGGRLWHGKRVASITGCTAEPGRMLDKAPSHVSSTNCATTFNAIIKFSQNMESLSAFYTCGADLDGLLREAAVPEKCNTS